jgi:hypothetical protein
MIVASLCAKTCGGQLYLHVVGATALFGGALAVTILAFAASRYPPEQTLFVRRLAFWLTLFIMVPAWILMRVGGQLALTNEHLDKSTPGWVNAGFGVSDGGAVLILLLLLVTWLGWKRPRLAPLGGALGTLYIVALGVAWFAMSYKPAW